MKTLIDAMSLRKRSALITHGLCSSCIFLFALAVFGLLCIADKTAQADSIPIWDVTGTLTITGNNVCGLSPCVETIKFSFDYTYTLVASEYVGELLGTASVSSYGALGSSFAGLYSPQNPFIFCQPNANYMPMFNSGGDEIDLYACGNAESTPAVPSFRGDLWHCVTASCITDFAPAGSDVCDTACVIGTVQESVAPAVQVPEGGTALEYALMALLPIGFAIWHSKSVRVRARAAARELGVCRISEGACG
jgi:hypothetical protein